MILEAIPSSEKETNPWVSAEARFDEAAELLGLDEGLRKILRTPALELKVSVPVMLDDGRYEVFTGYRVQHSIVRGPSKGGIRFAPDVTLDEVRAPNMNPNPKTMGWVMDPYSMHKRKTVTGVVTGKPLALGGSKGRTEATGRGCMIVTLQALRQLGLELAKTR